MLKFIWERFHQKYPSISKSAFNKLYKQYEAIKPFKSCENIFESGQNINDLIHYILRLATQYHLTEAFKAMKVDLNDPNVAEIADLDNIGTPGRIAKIWVGSSTDDDCELGGGRFSKPIRLAKFPNVYGSRIIEKSFDLVSNCSHHFLPFFNFEGKCTISYIPNEFELGISKLQRIVNFVAQRFWLQEDLTKAIYEAISTAAETDKVLVKLENVRHSCEAFRGAKTKSGSLTTTYGNL